MSTDDTNITAEAPAPTPEELQTKLTQLRASATQQYSLKNYNQAAEFYSEAAEFQDELNGEMSLENADLLYQYGRCLYHVAVANSDVLGGKVASEEPKKNKKKRKREVESEASDALKDGKEKMAEKIVEEVVEEKEGASEVKKEAEVSKPYFQITGDENFTDSEEDDDEDGTADAQAEEEEDDFATAFEVLDMARILLSKKVAALQSQKAKDEEVRHLQERLADTHDLQAEISLENERFHDAIKDTRDALALKLQIYPSESSLVAEAHFKLSLALEFASVTAAPDADGDSAAPAETRPARVDTAMREEAAAEMKKAIASCELRIEKESTHLITLAPATPEHTALQKSIVDVKEMVSDMKTRLVDLRNPATSLAGPSGPAGAPGIGGAEVRGILGDLLGESKGEQERRVKQAMAGANDLSGLVKRKKVKPEGVNGDGKGKRKMDDDEVESAGSGKKVKFEDGA